MAAVCLKKQHSVIPFFPPELASCPCDWETESLCCVQGGWDTSGSELSEGELEKRRRTLLEQLDAPWSHFRRPPSCFLYTSTVMHSPLNQSDSTGYTVSDRLWDTTNLCYLQECSRLTSGKADQLLLLVLALNIFFFRNSSFSCHHFLYSIKSLKK